MRLLPQAGARTLLDTFDHDQTPMIWDEDPDELANEVVDATLRLVDLYRGAAGQGQAILSALT